MTQPDPPRSTSSRATWALAGFVGFVVALVLLGGAWLLVRAAARPRPVPSAVTVLRPSPSVVVAIRNLAELSTAEYHVERIIDLREKQRTVFGLIQAEDALLLVASGQVTAGVDLAQLSDESVTIDEVHHRARITLPAPRVLHSRIDNDRTYVYRRETDLLAHRQEQLEARARQEAERSIVQAAEESGIRTRARDNARRTVESLVRSLGYTDVEVDFEPTTQSPPSLNASPRSVLPSH